MRICSMMVRWILAAGCGYFAAWAAVKGATMGIVGGLFFFMAIGGLIAAVLLISPETTGRFIRAIANFFVGLIYPDERFSKPVLSYALARLYRKQARIEEAIREYEKILRYYPKEKDAYVELLTLALETGQMAVYQKYARRMKKRLHCEIEVVQGTALPPEEEISADSGEKSADNREVST